ncbi:MAG: VanZ family protein [Nitrospirales bacterium]|nr:VanZ family protein [Nitrospirales bacterium]
MHTVSHESAAPLSAKLVFLSWVIVIIFGTTLPWHTLHPHPQWWRIDWLPFHSGTLRPRLIFDIAVNVVMYLPFGYLCRQWIKKTGGRMSFFYVVGFAAGLSCCTEFIQIFNPVRFPAIADVVMNVTGALLGAWAVLPRDNQSQTIVLDAPIPTHVTIH